MSSKHIGYNPNKHLLIDDRVYVPGSPTTRNCYIRFGMPWEKDWMHFTILFAACWLVVLSLTVFAGPHKTDVLLKLLIACAATTAAMAYAIQSAYRCGMVFAQADIKRRDRLVYE